jgi:hypothetical protein
MEEFELNTASELKLCEEQALHLVSDFIFILLLHLLNTPSSTLCFSLSSTLCPWKIDTLHHTTSFAARTSVGFG